MKRLLSGNRVIWLLATVAVVFLAAGVILSRFIQSPADAAAQVAPPAAGLITVPVENRVIANDVTLRADVLYDESVEVKLDTTDISGTPVVTGQVLEVGTTIEGASVILEVAGRPVIALPGELPAYRSLRVGVSGPDVLQLKQSLGALGIAVGNAESDVYDAATAAAVDKLYVMAGYTSPAPAPEDAAALENARSGLASARSMLSDAEAALSSAQSGPSQSERMQQDSLVNQAQRDLDAAIAARDTPASPEDGPAMSPAELQAVADTRQEALDIAVATRAEVLKGAGTAAEVAARDAARTAVTDAQKALDEAQRSTLTALPAGEITYFPSLPRRVDQVNVSRGQTVSGASAFMTVSGAEVIVQGSVAASDAELLEVGQQGTFALEGVTGTATITEIKAADSSTEGEGDSGGSGGDKKAGRFTVVLTPEGLTDEQIAALQGRNLKVTIPVNSTGDEVLSVPSAALTAGAGGEARIERKLEGETTELITVETGLAAGGFVQITSSEKPLAEDDLVVVGK